MTSAFISYSHRDSQVAYDLAKLLAERGADIFIDELGLRPGSFWQQLGSEILRRDYFIVLLSPDSARSKWVPKEVAWAFSAKDEGHIIPIVVSPLSLEDWQEVFVLIAFQHIDLTKWPQSDRTVEAVSKLLRYMNLPSEPLVSPRPLELFEETEEREGEEEEEEPWLSITDIQQLMSAANTLEGKNPRKAFFLYRQAMVSLRDYVRRYGLERGDILPPTEPLG